MSLSIGCSKAISKYLTVHNVFSFILFVSVCSCWSTIQLWVWVVRFDWFVWISCICPFVGHPLQPSLPLLSSSMGSDFPNSRFYCSIVFKVSHSLMSIRGKLHWYCYHVLCHILSLPSLFFHSCLYCKDLRSLPCTFELPFKLFSHPTSRSSVFFRFSTTLFKVVALVSACER